MSSYRKAIASNTIYQIINKFVTAGATLLISALITRLLGAETYGEYSIVSTYVITFFLLSDFGVNAIVVQDFAKNVESAKNNFAKVLSLRLTFGLFLLAIAFITLHFMPYSDTVKLAITISLPLILFSSLSSAASLIFQSFLRYDYQAKASVWGSSITLILTSLSIYFLGDSLVGLVIAYVIGSAIAPLLSLYFIREYISKDTKWIDLPYWTHVVKDAFPMGMALSLNVLMIHADRLILSIQSTPYSVGIYSLSYKIFDVVLVLPTFFMNATYPVLVKMKDESEEKYRLFAAKVFVYLFLASITLTLFAYATSWFLIPLIWGPEMAASIAPFNILATGLAFFFLSAPLSWVALIEGKKIFLMWIYGIAFVGNAALNWMLIPVYDYYAAAYLTVVTEAFVFLILAFLVGGKFVKYFKEVKISEIFEFKKYVRA
jgi:O-antigen/teichoic acid export membrane protein